MNELFKKLNFKSQKEIIVLNYPESFEVNLILMKEFTNISVEIQNEIEFFIKHFVHTNKTILKIR